LGPLGVTSRYEARADAVIYSGRCEDLLDSIPSECVRLVVTSPPYNLGKEYERRVDLDAYVDEQTAVIERAVRVLTGDGSICWQVGNHVHGGEVFPLD